jgi:hypothetical protein
MPLISAVGTSVTNSLWTHLALPGTNMNCFLVSLDGQAELQPHDLPHLPTVSFLHCLHKTSPESPVNQGTNSILPLTKKKGLRQAR